MKLLAFSDWRNHSLDPIRRVIEKEEPDAVLYLGDDLGELVSYYNDEFVYPPGVKWGRWIEKQIVLHPDWSKEEAEKLLAFTLATQGMNAIVSLSEKNEKEIKHRKQAVKDFSHNLETILNRHLTAIGDFVILGGACSVNAASEYENKQGFFDSLQIPVFFVNGNDGPMLYEDGIWHLAVPTAIGPDRRGMGWIPIKEAPTIGPTTFIKNEEAISLFGLYASWGKESIPLNLPDRYTDIVLSHVPPYGCLDLARRFGVNNIGSRELREAIERYSPKLVLCGHVHQQGGQMMQLGETTIANVSTHDTPSSPGNYAIISTEDWSVRLKQVSAGR